MSWLVVSEKDDGSERAIIDIFGTREEAQDFFLKLHQSKRYKFRVTMSESGFFDASHLIGGRP